MPKRVANAELPLPAPPSARIESMLFILIDKNPEDTNWIKVERALADELGLADDWARLANGRRHGDIFLTANDERAAASRLSCASYEIDDRAAALAEVRGDAARECDRWHLTPRVEGSNIFARGSPVGAAIRVWMCE